jgi:response regulator of citrate/malate metabolism
MDSYGILHENIVLEKELIDYLDRITFLKREWSCSFENVEEHLAQTPVDLLFINVENPSEEKMVLLKQLACSNNTIIIASSKVLSTFNRDFPPSIIAYITRPPTFDLVVNAVIKYSMKFDDK